MAVDDKRTSLSGLTETEAQEFHGIFVRSFLLFTLIAVIAHILAWMWRPWLPPVGGWASVQDGVSYALATMSSMIV
jgi:light-harvesting complex 1 beta chain